MAKKNKEQYLHKLTKKEIKNLLEWTGTEALSKKDDVYCLVNKKGKAYTDENDKLMLYKAHGHDGSKIEQSLASDMEAYAFFRAFSKTDDGEKITLAKPKLSELTTDKYKCKNPDGYKVFENDAVCNEQIARDFFEHLHEAVESLKDSCKDIVDLTLCFEQVQSANSCLQYDIVDENYDEDYDDYDNYDEDEYEDEEEDFDECDDDEYDEDEEEEEDEDYEM